MKTLAEIKDEVAREHKFPEWDIMEFVLKERGLESWAVSRMHTVCKEYAKQALEEAAERARCEASIYHQVHKKSILSIINELK